MEGLKTITKNLKITKNNLQCTCLIMIVLFTISLVFNIINRDKIEISPLNKVDFSIVIKSFTDVFLVIIEYLIISIIPNATFTKILLFFNVAMILGGIGYTFVIFLPNHSLIFILRLIRQIDYIFLVYNLAVISIQVVSTNKFQNYQNYFSRWFASMKAELSQKKWIKLVFLILIYWGTTALAVPY